MTKLNVYQKLNKVQTKLKAPKTQRNSFGNYNYRSLEDIQEALKPLLAEYGAIVLLEDNIVTVGDRYYVEALAKFVDIESGEEITAKAYAREDVQKRGMDLSQLTGSTSSYARKYALNGLFAIDDTKDSDATNNHGKTKPNTNNNRAAPRQVKTMNPLVDKQKQLVELAKVKGKTNEMPKLIKEMFNKEHSNQLTVKEIDKLIARLKSE